MVPLASFRNPYVLRHRSGVEVGAEVVGTEVVVLDVEGVAVELVGAEEQVVEVTTCREHHRSQSIAVAPEAKITRRMKTMSA